jgi:hypothetical protein
MSPVTKRILLVVGILVLGVLAYKFLAGHVAVLLALTAAGAAAAKPKSLPVVEQTVVVVDAAVEDLDSLPEEVQAVRDAVVTEDYLEPLDLSR